MAAIKSGDDIKTVQGNLGHATAAFTLDVYGHVTDQMKQESAQRMENYIKRCSGPLIRETQVKKAAKKPRVRWDTRLSACNIRKL